MIYNKYRYDENVNTTVQEYNMNYASHCQEELSEMLPRELTDVNVELDLTGL